MSNELKLGLEGVLVAESELSYIDGDAGKLGYRGYSIEDLASEATYEEVVYLLWHGELPTREELDSFKSAMVEERTLADGVVSEIRELAEADEEPMAALRTIVSTLSAYDPDADADPTDAEANARKGRRITAKIPTALAAFTRIRNGEEPVAPDSDLDHAANFLYMLNGEEPGEAAKKTMDLALTLHAEHGLNASTFTARVIGATLADSLPAAVKGAERVHLALTADEVVRRVRKHRAKNQTRLVIVDYATLLRGYGRVRDTREIVSDAATRLMEASKDDIAYVLLAQLNRDCEKRDNKRPVPSDLKESGALEERAKCVIFPFRPYEYDKDEDPRLIELNVAKNNFGRKGVVKARWHGPTARVF